LETVKRRNHLEELGVDGRIILKQILIGCDDVDWILLTQVRVQWRAVLNTVIKFRVS
jgi:hypothetical protein